MLEGSMSAETLLPSSADGRSRDTRRKTWAIGEITPRISGILRIVP